MKRIVSQVALGGLAAVLCAGVVASASAATITAPRIENLNHAVDESAFFTATTTNTPFAASGGWAPIAPTQAGAVSTTTPKKSFSIVGDSTAAGNWVDGNGVPAGISLSFDAQFTIGITPSSPVGSLLTHSASVGNGVGIVQAAGATGELDGSELLSVSAVTVSNIIFSGSLTDPNFSFTPGTVSGFGTRVLRSSTFLEGSEGLLLTSGAGTIGFGNAPGGTLASGLLIDNNFGPPPGTATSSVFARQTGPYTLAMTAGTAPLKGIGLGYDITYDINAVPEPAGLALAALGCLGLAGVRSRRHDLG
jgi:hypothetical protein